MDTIDAPRTLLTDHPRPRRGTPAGWLISGAVHGAAVLLATAAVFGAAKVAEKDPPPLRTSVLTPPEKKPEKPLKRDIEDKPLIETIDTSDTPAPATDLVVSQVAEAQADSDPTEPSQNQGRDDAQATAETGGPSTFMAIGTGPNGSGIIGSRNPIGRKRQVQKGDATPASERAVEGSLRWFVRHQSPSGAWEADRYFQNCTEGARCEPGRNEGGDEGCRVAMTGYAVLCFLGGGYDHTLPNKYRQTVRRGIQWLLAQQRNDGVIGQRNYEHPIATMALAEAYAMSADPALRSAAQKAVDVILARQNQDKTAGPDGYIGGLGWDYVNPTARNDSSVTGWNVMALKSAKIAGLDVGKGIEGSRQWLERHWRASNPAAADGFKAWADISAYDQSHFDYCWTTDRAIDKPANGRECIGLTCGIFLGRHSGDPLVESLANTVMAKQVPKAWPTNTYYLYYNAMGIYQLGGERWQTWNGPVRDLLVAAQRVGGGCADGSWDPQGTGPSQMSRVLSTAYCTLTLEVYYRYDQIEKLAHPGQEKRKLRL